MKIWTEPKVTLVGRTKFSEPAHMPVNWAQPTNAPSHPERLIEAAGRLCYMSQSNASGKTTEQYIDHIIEVDHGSVLEHVSVSFLLEGISRSCSHELVRHRAGTAFSQLSQRFVEHVDVVMPPAILALGDENVGYTRWEVDVEEAIESYERAIVHLQNNEVKGKKLKEAARSLLPNCAETKMVMTANVRAWRLILKRRIAKDADAEIQRLAAAILKELQALLPSCFKDIGV